MCSSCNTESSVIQFKWSDNVSIPFTAKGKLGSEISIILLLLKSKSVTIFLATAEHINKENMTFTTAQIIIQV